MSIVILINKNKVPIAAYENSNYDSIVPLIKSFFYGSWLPGTEGWVAVPDVLGIERGDNFGAKTVFGGWEIKDGIVKYHEVW